MRENLIKSDVEYNRILENMGGVDFSGKKKSVDKRYSYLENMYRDYTAGGSDLIESVPGFRRIHSGKRINGLHLQGTPSADRYLVINDGGELYRCNTKAIDSPVKLSGDATIDHNAKSHGFNFKGRLYLGDGRELIAVNADGGYSKAEDGAPSAPYVPTVYLNGKDHEQRNLLTSAFREQYNIEILANLSRGTPTLIYRVTDEKSALCHVCGILDDPMTVFIPSVTRIGDRDYSVVGIDMGAFLGKTGINTVRIGDSVVTIGTSAFFGCMRLTTVVCGSGITSIHAYAFAGTDLEQIYIPGAMKRFGQSSIPAQTVIKYELDADAYDLIEGAPGENVQYEVVVDTLELGIKLRSKATVIDSVTLNGKAIEFNTLRDEDNYISEILINDASKSEWIGATLLIAGFADPLTEQSDAKAGGFTARTAKDGRDFTRAIRLCTHSAVIDGRVFLWGNPDYPGLLFYSHREDAAIDGLYFGALDYIDEGANAEILSVLGFSGGILVFSRGANDGECIRLYMPEVIESGIERTVFKISEAHRGNFPLGAAINQGNEALYVTKDGLAAIGERSLYRTGSIYPRSTAVAAMLAGEDLTKATLTHWCGYVVLSIGGRMYLADTRAMDDFGGGKEYEWFFLSGVGAYRNDSRVYRYSTMAHHGYIVSETPDAIVKEEVWSEGIDSGIVFFVKSEDGKIEVYPTEEYSGGDFYPAEITLGFDDKLIFSTGCGDVFIFNNDMRGIAPQRIATDPDFDPEEYEKVMGRRIHPDFYAFHNHSPRYALICAYDDCGIPHLKKSTIRSSLTAKLAILGGGHIFCEVGRDGNGYHPVASVDGVSDFSNLSFSASPFACSTSVTVALPEHERGWVEKSIALYSEDFRSPFGMYSICYRYRISGRIKNS